MTMPHSKYSYSNLELEAHVLADHIERYKDSLTATPTKRAFELLRRLATKLHYARHTADLAMFALSESGKSDAVREAEALELRKEFNLKVVAD